VRREVEWAVDEETEMVEKGRRVVAEAAKVAERMRLTA
jgi:hypothetical protein